MVWNTPLRDELKSLNLDYNKGDLLAVKLPWYD